MKCTIESGVETLKNVSNSLLSLRQSGGERVFLNTARNTLDPYIFTILRDIYGGQLTTFWENTTTIPKVSKKAICFVERRCHPNLQFCLYNAAYFARDYAIHIFHSKDNDAFIKQICGKQLENIHLQPIFEDVGTYEKGFHEFNDVMQSKKVWGSMPEDYILFIQTDAYLIDHIPESIYKYDYVAPNYPWDTLCPGGGGLRFHNRHMMIQICEDDTIKSHNEDGFFMNGVKKYNYKYPNNDESNSYFIEAPLDIYAQPIGVHQWWTFINTLSDDIKTILMYKYITLNIE